MRARRFWFLLAAVVSMLATAGVAGVYASTAWALDILLWGQRAQLDGELPNKVFIDTPHGRVRTASGGEGPTLVLLHGFGDSAGGWAQTAGALTADYRVVAIDLLGHDPDADPTRELTYEAIAEALDVALATQPQPLILVGNSMGGWMSMQYALDHPERVERVVLMNAAGMRHPVDRDLLMPPSREMQAAKNEAVMGEHATPLPGFLLDQMSAHARRPSMLSLSHSVRSGRHFVDDRIGGLSVPANLIWGTPDPFFPLDYGQRLDAAIPASDLRTLDGCGHAPQYSCPDQFVATLREVLAQPPPEPPPPAQPEEEDE